MVRYRLLDIEIVLKKSLIYALLLLVLLLPCYFAVLWGQQAALELSTIRFLCLHFSFS